jgi:hypothetical protein
MFEDEIGDVTAWEAVLEALVGEQGFVRELEFRVRFGLTLFTGVQPAMCPALDTVTPDLARADAIAEALDTVGPPSEEEKLETPTSAALATVTEQLSELSGDAPRYILLISDATPDFCDDSLVDCARDAVVATVQQASDLGITTLLAGIESDATASGQGPYFQAVANAGLGLGVEPDDEIEDNCDPIRGDYSNGNDDAPYATSSDGFAAGIRALIDDTLCD